ncbi:hypothetical protein RhiJN_19893 [Ceratobasidium sp. AG-Ba]|nr:hypothetical protein RhiJN_19893 [Ceratobasidium sp. AG-Ba]
MTKAKRHTRSTRKKASVRSRASPERIEEESQGPGDDTPQKQPVKPRVSFTFEPLRDLISLLSDRQPWAAEHGTTTDGWTEIADKLNIDHSLNPPLGYRTVQRKVAALRKLHEDGKSAQSLRLPLTSEQHIQVASILDSMVTRWNAWEKERDKERGMKTRSIHRQEVLGAHTRHNAVLDVSAREPTPALSPPTPDGPEASQAPGRAMSAPLTGARSAPSVPNLVVGISAVVDRAEGIRAQRAEVFQREQIRATRDNTSAILRLAIATEQISSTFADFSERYFKP